MPELPEVEVTRLSFASRILGAQVLSLRMGKPLRWPLGCDPGRLEGARVGPVLRRGKYLWVPLSLLGTAAENPPEGLLVHLGMSGALTFAKSLPPRGPHDHFELDTTAGLLRLTDPRRFGAVVWGASMGSGLPARLLAGLGLEPFDEAMTGAYLHQRLKGRKVSIKQALLAGDIVVGAGNIYACEALFMAGIDPRLAAGRVSRPRCDRLVLVVQEVLRQALAMGGSSLRDFKDAYGSQGHFQLSTRVYGREGEPCRTCATPVRRLVQGQRSTFFCPVCQKK
ncbi:bifunctional DNA-formamidopyrimidine glycosylase/DNA-(apurinic or apyrimidinic site) lyase [Aquabacterium sp.]|uniref:bifunctional DNA-formamidopyrimidine glycosylase/DNA-(apurinic or apyrimidinic site) lyase n=1 Tax=Aquabacterium sp. TaxID=1872578 RepID=UPI002486E8D3|nr:bifunctional DNA-formamidopyrimidine glycosylase/DNA-(apurinic or apyrimidinic site) lyase [Aquabacterium sp.]MDI1261096.1 bifunctional DNA-formamidopyrimidine glycosylase/DNA-(apurinic or apyrimidinic site) lyase [Aquabacterium sp.]